MLTSLHIENIAIIEKSDIVFNSGFNILTGETGAGKSIVIDSINAILGERTSRDLIRTGADHALVSAVFEDLDPEFALWLEELGYECADGSLIVNRKLTSDGKNVIRINGLPANVTVLKEIGKRLINIHGQHDSQSLLSPSSHIGYIDSVADDHVLLNEYKDAYSLYLVKEKEYQSITLMNDRSEERMDLLRFEIAELEAAEIEVGERDELIRQRDFIRNSESIAQALNTAKGILSGADEIDGVSEMLFSAADRLTPCIDHFKKLQSISERLSGFGYEIQEIIEEIDACFDKLNFDPVLAEQIEERLDYLFRLSNKYGKTEQDILNYLENAKNELDILENSELRIEAAKLERDAALNRATELAERLSKVRAEAATRLSDAICKELAELDMPKVRFVCDHRISSLGSNGIDSMEFLISVNAGETPKPLAKIASGGELSRIMLAIKSVLADKNDVPTLIFDEIDTGISGHAAQQVGLKLKSIASNVQVLCVTHLPQIAALADHHYRITKSTDADRTFTQVEPLDRSERIIEVARIMSGSTPSQTMLASAEELIDNGEKL